MKLKRTPRPGSSTKTRRTRGATPRRGATRTGGSQARRPGVPIRRRIGHRLPALRRVLAVVGAAAALAALVAALNGPWLRVTEVGWSGLSHTTDAELADLLDEQRGRSLLAVDTHALGSELEALPSVESATVVADITGRLHAAITEPAVAFVWENNSARFLGAADGTLFGAATLGALDEALQGVPRIEDARFIGRRLAVGDRIPAPLLDAAMRVSRIDPAALGSSATRLRVELDDEFGFRLVSTESSWELALGVYGVDPNESAADAAARLERQVTAVRTLFAARPESDIGWVDVRNPGKVYFRAKS